MIEKKWYRKRLMLVYQNTFLKLRKSILFLFHHITYPRPIVGRAKQDLLFLPAIICFDLKMFSLLFMSMAHIHSDMIPIE